MESKHLIGPLSANLAYQVTRQTHCPWSKMGASSTLPSDGLITRIVLGNTGRVQGSCVRVGGVGGKWQLNSALLSTPTISTLPGGRMAGPVGAATMVDSWHKMGFSLKYETACAALCQTHTGRDAAPYFGKHLPPKSATRSQTPNTILNSLPLHKDPLYWSGLHQTMAMATTINIMLTHSSLVKIIKDTKLFWENIFIEILPEEKQ